MIRRIIAYFFIFDLVLALGISLIWMSNGTAVHTIRLGQSLLPFIKQISVQVEQYGWSLPSFSSFHEQFPEAFGNIVRLGSQFWLFNIVRVVVVMYDSLVNILNFIVFLVNCILEVIQFLMILFSRFNDLQNVLAQL